MPEQRTADSKTARTRKDSSASDFSAPFITTDNTIYQKSNYLIGAKFRSTLLANRILALSLANADKFDYGTSNSERETILSVLPVSEIRAALGANNGSFYQQLDQTAKSMTGKSIGMSTPDSKAFDYVAVVTRARLDHGRFIIEYNGALRPVLQNLTKQFTQMSLRIQLRLKTNNSFRLYELLKSKCYHSKNDPDQNSNTYYIRMALSELKLELGLVNAELDTVKRVLRNSENPDYDKAVELAPERMYDSWSEFRRKVLTPSIDEINSVTDLHVDWQPEKSGVGGKVHAVDFIVTVSDPASVINPPKEKGRDGKSALTVDEQLDFLDDLRDSLNGEFTSKELRNLCNAAGWDKEKILQSYHLMQQQRQVSNPVGWMLSAIRNGYGYSQNASATSADPASSSAASGSAGADRSHIPGNGAANGSSASRSHQTRQHGFEQRSYDFNQIENELLNQ